MFMTELSVNDLVQAKELAAKVTKQFPLRLAKVKAIIKSIKTHNQFMSAFSLAVFNDTWYLVGGRHRLQALLTMISESEDGTVLEATADEQVFPCLVHECESLADVVLLTQFDNDSRSMPPAEKQYLGFSFEATLDGEDYAVNTVSRLRTAYLYLDIKHNSLNSNTVRQIWGAVIGTLDKGTKKLLTTNEQALRAFGKRFEELLVPAAKSTSTPARNYKKVAEHILLANLVDVLQGFDVIHKQALTKQDREDVAILGAALERSLKSDKIDEARGVVVVEPEQKAVRRSAERVVFDQVRADAELAMADDEEAPF